MKKLIVLLFIILMFYSCKSVENWEENPVLSINVVTLASEYLINYNSYLKKLEMNSNATLNDNPTTFDLDNKLSLEKDLAISSNNLLQLWFNFIIELQLDPNYLEAYKGHYYFRKALDSLRYIELIRSKIDNNSISFTHKKYLEELFKIEEECRLYIVQEITYNYSDIDIEMRYKNLKKLYRKVK